MVPRNLEDDYIKSLLSAPRRRIKNLYLGLEKEWSEQEYIIAKTSARYFLDQFEARKVILKDWGKHYVDQWNLVLDPRLFRVAFNELEQYNTPCDEISEREIFNLDKLIEREMPVQQGMTLRFPHMGKYRYQYLMGKMRGRVAPDLAAFGRAIFPYHFARGYNPKDASNYLRRYPQDITYWELICVKYGYHDWMDKDSYPFLPIPNFAMTSAKSVKIVREA